MGPTGAGKTTIGALLASQLNWQFTDGDSFHPPANIAKMSRGVPLDDNDRRPWLEAIHSAMLHWIAAGQNVVLACSALKRSYREMLCAGPDVKLVYLKGSYDLLRQRIVERHGHFAGQQILAGQFADLKEPANAITLDAARSPQEIVAEIRKHLASA